MLFAALASAAGLVWGVADFAGGKAAQRADALAVVWLSKLVTLPLLLGCALAAETSPGTAGLHWGVAAGVVGTLGTVLFYRALSQGAMTIVAPVTSVTAAVVPVVAGLTGGERPSPPALAGICCAVLGIGLVSAVPSRTASARAAGSRLVGCALGAGLGFGLFMVCLARAGRSNEPHSLWPVLSSHVTGLVLGGVVLALARPSGVPLNPGSPRWPAVSLRWTIGAGALDTGGTALYLLASRLGDLSLVAPLASLYPVTTVVLALVVDKERPRALQLVGLGLAVAALQLIVGLTS